MRDEFIKLGWQICEWKLAYYRPELVHADHKAALTISDARYDQAEQRYKELAAKLNLEPAASDMVGFDLERPSCRLVARKHSLPTKSNLKSKGYVVE